MKTVLENAREQVADLLGAASPGEVLFKGIGALYVHRKAPFVPLMHGGHQERSRRGGTENVAGIAGLGAAAAVSLKKQPGFDSAIRPLRDALEHSILKKIPGSNRNGHSLQRLPNTSNLHFPGIESEAVLLLLDQASICASSGSACLADSPDPSHVIAAMTPGDSARQSVRFSLGSDLTAGELGKVASSLAVIIPPLLSLNP